MSRLARRLQRLRTASLPSSAAEEVERGDTPTGDERDDRPVLAGHPTLVSDGTVEGLRQAIRRILERQVAKPSMAPVSSEPMPGELFETPHGWIRRILTVHEPHHHHGRVPVQAALTACSSALSALAGQPEVEGADLRRALYVDTETTGLTGGTGTVPFLVGLGGFEDESFVVEQLVLEELAEEPPLMARVRERWEAASCIVTFNGKAYDAPLLRTRGVMTRTGPWPERPHVDLLHLCRRSYRWRLDGFRLVELERAILGFEREHDIDGAEVPGAYWSFLRSSRPSFLLPVLEHNLHDIVALAALLAEVARGYAEVDPRSEPEDQASRALWALTTGDHPRVEAFARSVEAGGAEGASALEAYLAAATAARRQRDVQREARWLDRALTVARSPEDEARVRLARAKHFEHRARRLEDALREARALAQLVPGTASAQVPGTTASAQVPGTDVERRIERLERRLAAAGSETYGAFGAERRGVSSGATLVASGTEKAPTTRTTSSLGAHRLRSAFAALRSRPE